MQRDRRENRSAWRRWLFLALAVLVMSTSGVFGREWSDSSGGFKVQAELVDLEEGKVRLLREDGKIISVPLERLSVSDRKYVYVQMGQQPAVEATSKQAARVAELEDLEPPRRWALLIGVNDYNELSDLKFCVADARAMHKGLLAAGFHEERIWRLTSDAKSPKYLPFKANIQRQMELVLGQVGPRDLIVVALSGHGMHLEGTSYFCAVEARPEAPKETMVSLDYVYESLTACNARQKLLLVDACRNDPRVEGTRSVDDSKSTLSFSQTLEKPPQGILALSSCAPGELSFEDGVLGGGVFIHFVVEGLAGKADREEGNVDGQVSLLELYRYSSTHTKSHVARQYNQSQTPMLRGEIPLDFEISTARIAPEVQAVLDRGDDFFRKGRYEEAVASCTEAIRMDDKCATAYNGRGVSHSYRKDWDSAILDYTLAIHLNPKESLYWANRGKAYHGRREYDRAIADFTEAIRLDPKDAVAYANRGSAYDDKDEHDRAIADFTEAIRLDPKDAVAYANRGLAYDDKDEHDRAIADYSEAIRLEPEEAIVYNNRGSAYAEKGEYDLAIADCTKAIRLDPEEAIVYNNRGLAYADKNKYDQAIADFTEAIRLDPEEAIVYNNRGSAYAEKGEYDLAIADCTKAIRLDPEEAIVYNNRGLAYADKNEYDRAIADFTEAIRLDPKDAVAYANRGLAYDDKDEHDRAIADYSEAIRLEPEDATTYFNRGVAYCEKKDYDRAIADFTEAIRLKPNDASAYSVRGPAYYVKGDYDQAFADLTEAIRLEPEDALAYESRAFVYRKLGEEAKAEADEKRAAELKGDK